MCMKTAILIAVLVATPRIAAAQCPDNGADHGRHAVKTRSAPSPFPSVDAIEVADVIKFLVPHVGTISDTALVGTEERQILHVRAFVRLFKCEADADYHLEIADSGAANARRIIVEASETEPAVRSRMEAMLGGAPSKKGRPFDGVKAVPIELWGWRFLDLDHQSALVDSKTHRRRTMAQLKKGHAHGSARVGTLWEVHPILRVEPWTP